MKLHFLADDIFRYLSEPTDISIPAIAMWLRGAVGSLNLKIGTNYTITSVGEITPELDYQTAAIFQQMYFVYFYDRLIRSNLGAASIDTILEATSDGGTIRLASRNEISKSYIQAKKIAVEELNGLVDDYILSEFQPIQTCGSDTDSPVGAYNLDDKQR